MPSPLQISLKVVGLDQAKADLQTFAQGGRRSFDELSAEAKRLSDSSLQTDRALTGVANRVRSLASEFDPATAASLRLRNSLTDIERATATGIITAGQAATVTARLRAEHDRLNDSSGRITVSSRQAMYALRDFGFQVNDVVSGLAMGQTPMRIFTQQAGQFVQVFQQGGGASTVLGAVGTAIRSWITPTTAAVAGVAALTGGFVALLARASANAEQLRQFNLILQGTGKDSLTTANNLQQVVRQLRDMGVSRDDATTAVTAIARNPRLNPARAGDIAQTGLDVGARLGIGDAAGIQKFTDAIGGGVEGVLKLGFAMSALSVTEATNIRDMARHGQQAEALNQAITAVARNISGGYKDSLTESRKAINELSSAWQGFLDKLSDSTAINNIRRLLTENLKDWADLLSGDIRSVLERNGLLSPRASGPAVDWRAERNAMIRGGNPAAGNYPGGALTPGGALDLIEQFESGGRNIPNFMFGPGRTAQGYFQITNSTWRDIAGRAGIDLGQYPNAMSAPYDVQRGAAAALFAERGFAPWAPYNPALRGAIDRLSRSAAGNLGASGDLGGAASPIALPDAAQLTDAETALRKLRETEADTTRIAKLWGIEQQAAQAYLAEKNRALAEGVTAEQAEQRAQIAATGARERGNIELQKAATVQDAQTAALLKTAAAFRVSEAAGYRVAAEEQARIEVMQRGGDVAQRTRQILEESAASAIRGGEQQLAAAQPQIAALERLAEATRGGAAAAHEQELQNQAAAATQDALAKAEASRNPELIAQAKALNDAALAEVRRTDAARQTQQIYAAINQRADQAEIVGLQTSLIGQTPEVIAAATAHLQEQQRLIAAKVDLNSQIAKDDLASVDALHRANIEYETQLRNQQRIEDGIRSIADTIDNTLTRSIEDAFSGNRVEDWGKRLRSMIGSLVSSVTSSLFLRPLTGTLLGALGFGGLASQYGTFGGLSGPGAGGGAVTLIPDGNGGFSLGTLASGASLLNSVSGGGLFGAEGLFSGVGSFLSGGLGGIFAHAPTAADFAAGVGPVISAPGSIFGTTTLGGFLGGAGAGFGAGALLNSLIGGNQLGGTIGSGLGALGGAALGSIFPGVGTLLGGLLGGAGGGLFGGLFGNNRPAANESAATIDLATGRIIASASHGVSANDAQVKQFTDALNSFSQNLRQLTGGTLSGTINPVFSERDGLRLNYNIAGYGTGAYTASSIEDAVNVAKLATARSLEGVTDTIRTVIAAVSDPANLDAAIQFAATYDKIAKAAADSFASIPGDLDQTGPFAQAKQQITAIFDELTANAQKFGLSLDPVNAALGEANRRLTEDFNRSTADAIKAIEHPEQSQIDAVKRAGDALVKEAEAVGGDVAQVYRLTTLQLEQIAKQVEKQQTEQAEGLLSSLPGDLGQGGQFARAAQQLAEILDGFPEKVQQYTVRLTQDFDRSIGDAIVAIETPWQAQIDAVTRAGEALVKEAQAVGGDVTQVYRLTALQLQQIEKQQVQQAESLLSSLPGDLGQGGQFARAAEQLVAIFGSASAKLSAYMSRLRDDFNRSTGDSILAIEQPAVSQIYEVRRAGYELAREALAIGADVTQVYRLTALQLDQVLRQQADSARSILSSLPGDLGAEGPFAQAAKQIDTMFNGLPDKLSEFHTRLTEDVNRSIGDMILAIEDPLRAMVEAERRAGEQRLADAKAVGGNLVEVNRLNALKIEEIWKNQTKSLTNLRDALVAGDLSGKAATELSAAANDNFKHLIGLVTAGDTSQIDAAAQAGQTAIQQAITAYGNAPQTEALRASIIAAINTALAGHSFAEGGITSPGWNRVGERGPEWLYLPGAAMVLPSGQSPPTTSTDLAAELRAMRAEQTALLRTGNQIAQAVAAEIVRLLTAQLIEARRTPPPADPPRRAA